MDHYSTSVPTLGHIATHTRWLHFSYRRCPRAGRYRNATLITRFGPVTEMHEVIDALAADCPRSEERRWTELCRARCPTLGATGRRSSE